MKRNRTQSFALNSFFSIVNQFVVMIVGFIIPRLMLTYYGSETNGLVSSIMQFINYFTIVEAGLSGAAIFSLYKPLSDNNIVGINGIVSSAKHYYYQAGFMFTFAVFVLAGVYPLFININSLGGNSIRFLVVMLGAKGFLDFFSLAKYRTLLTADQKMFIISIASTLYTILNAISILLLSINRIPITYVYMFSLLPLLLRTFILSRYVKKNYSYIDFNAESNNNALKTRWDALFQQFVGMAQNSAPPIIATIFLSLKEVSIYAIYNMVISGINGILTIFTSSLSASFGNVIAKGEKETLKKVYHEFEYIYLQVIGVAYSVSYIMLLPFVTIYTKGIQDTNYDLPIISTLMIINGFLYTIKTPQGMLIIAAGHYKETRWRSLFQALILIFGAIILVEPFGLSGIILGAILSNLYRVIDMFFYVPKKITGLSYLFTLKNYGLLFLTMATTIVFSEQFVSNPTNWVSWITMSFLCVFISIIDFCVVSYIFNRKIFNSILLRIKIVVGLK